MVPFDHWGYIPTQENPADLATRGISVDIFLNSSFWIEGPDFLKSPIILNHIVDNNLDLEKRKVKPSCNLAIDTPYLISVLNRTSSFLRLNQIFAYVNVFISKIRYFRNLKHDSLSPCGPLNSTLRPIQLSVLDLTKAKGTVIRVTQGYYFSKDYTRLYQQKSIGKKSILCALNPFLDNLGLLQSATRLANAKVSYDRKCPIILPARS